MKFIFNKKSESSDHRFIRLDGSVWDSKSVSRFVSRTENQITLLGALGVVAFTLATEGRLDVVNSQILHNAGAMVVGSLGMGVSFDRFFTKQLPKSSIWNSGAIDTEGRSFPSKDFNLSMMFAFERFIKKGYILSATTSFVGSQSFLYSFLFNKEPFVSAAFCACAGTVFHMAVMSTAATYRSHKLIKGHSGEENGYIFTGDTPSKKGKSKDSIFSFLRKQAPSA